MSPKNREPAFNYKRKCGKLASMCSRSTKYAEIGHLARFCFAEEG